MRKHLVPIFLAISLITPVVIFNSGCGTLDPAGIYAGDKVLYESDVVLTMSYETLRAFATWELTNREVLKASAPDILPVANNIRANAPQWFATAYALQDAYREHPDAGTRTALVRSLAVLRAATAEATKYMALSTVTK